MKASSPTRSRRRREAHIPQNPTSEHEGPVQEPHTSEIDEAIALDVDRDRHLIKAAGGNPKVAFEFQWIRDCEPSSEANAIQDHFDAIITGPKRKPRRKRPASIRLVNGDLVHDWHPGFIDLRSVRHELRKIAKLNYLDRHEQVIEQKVVVVGACVINSICGVNSDITTLAGAEDGISALQRRLLTLTGRRPRRSNPFNPRDTRGVSSHETDPRATRVAKRTFQAVAREINALVQSHGHSWDYLGFSVGLDTLRHWVGRRFPRYLGLRL